MNNLSPLADQVGEDPRTHDTTLLDRELLREAIDAPTMTGSNTHGMHRLP